MSQNQGQWESQQDPSMTPEDKAGLQREKDAEFEQRWAEKERKWAGMKAEVEARHHRASNQPQAWAHWEYTPEEWARLDRLDWGRPVLRYWLIVGLVILVALAGVALLLGGGIVPVLVYVILAPLGGIMVGLSLTALIILLATGLSSSRSSNGEPTTRRHEARQDASARRTVTLSGKGMWQAGVFCPLERSWSEESEDDPEKRTELLEVRLSTQPTVLHFRVTHHMTYRGRSKSTYFQETIPLLVPQAYESEAEQIVSRYRKVLEERARDEVIKRAEREKLAHPPEPI